MAEDLGALIRTTAAKVRARDFLWTTGISAGLAFAFIVTGFSPDWRVAVVAWIAFIAALAVRYRLSAGREWASPVQRVVENQMSADRAELARLRLARGVAEALPEPLFILAASGQIELANPAAEEFLSSSKLEGRHFAVALRAPAVFEAVEQAARGEPAQVVEFATTGAVERQCRAYVAPLGDARPPEQLLVYVRDLTAEKRVEQMRADFIASASHELRTPLASLLGFIETLRGHARDDAEAREKFLGIMQAQAQRMQRLVADLMSLSKIELNEHVPPRDVVDITDLAEDVVASLKPVHDEAGTVTTFEKSGGRIVILGDRDELFQAVQNLVDNAHKYGGDTARVIVRVGRGPAPLLADDGEPTNRSGDTLSQFAARQGASPMDFGFVQVRDFGPGIERSALPRLTERFYRVNVERSKKAGGTGLGLAIVKHVVNRHKGSLQIESRLAAGTAFTCYFRLAPSSRGAE
jgi:two-component system phosphate regulon sensor histidine kinase PhoR